MKIETINIEQLVNNTPPFLLFICFIVYLGSIIFIFYSIPNALKTNGFLKTIGTITSGGVSSQTMGVGNSAEARLRSYQTHIDYTYKIDGKKYKSSKRKWHEAQTSFHSYHQKICDKYPTGSVVDVFYDPKKHDSSVLEKGLGFASYFAMFLAFSGMSFISFFIIYQYG